MRETLVYNAKLGVSGMPKSEYIAKYGGMNANRSDIACPMLIRDIDPYQSVATGEMIGGRAQHREHLRTNGLEEVGNELPTASAKPDMPSPHEDVARAIDDVQNGRGVKVTESYNPMEFEDD